MPSTIEVQQLTKRFGDFHAVKDLSFTVNEGDVCGFLGQNGAGKSTTIRMLLTLIRPSSGEIFINGKDIKSHRKEILEHTGAIIERPDLYNYLTAAENLTVFARLNGIRPSHKLIADKLAQVGLAERSASKVKTFSQGMKQRLGIAVSMVHDPSLIILDEPTNGLDPQGIADMRSLIIGLSREHGKTILVSSHLLAEIEQIATRMVIIDRGTKIVEGDMKDLLDPEFIVMEIATTDDSQCMDWLRKSSWVGALQSGKLSIATIKVNRKDVPQLTRDLVLAGIDILSIRPMNTLEEYFLSLTNPRKNVEPN